MAKGVATFTDVVFLLLIAGVASAILFYSAANYGSNLNKRANELLLDYYARQAVRVISTATIQKDPSCAPDYLLAFLKERAYYGELDDTTTQDAIAKVLGNAMKPLSTAYDYALVITLGTGDSAEAYIFSWYHDPSSGFRPVENHCKKTMGDFRGWLSGFAGRVPVYSYSVPLRFKLQSGGSDVYVIGRMHMVIWPAGSSITSPC
ncbi:MAG: hypothetical protein PWP76_383 [Candidatus Diapherotrites archaeon]|nr:hypothetical protein [Candidatus Diapherotrites archaeon]MDN5366735.1 hypothetical protein [Candidatus Diapherotrites archaeon]